MFWRFGYKLNVHLNVVVTVPELFSMHSMHADIQSFFQTRCLIPYGHCTRLVQVYMILKESWDTVQTFSEGNRKFLVNPSIELTRTYLLDHTLFSSVLHRRCLIITPPPYDRLSDVLEGAAWYRVELAIALTLIIHTSRNYLSNFYGLI